MARGIINLGNTCSINALIQCLAHSRIIRQYFTSARIQAEHTGVYCITYELVQLLRELWNKDAHDAIMPQRFIASLYEKFGRILHQGEQHDICEVCTLLCDKVAEECFSPNALKKYELSKDDVAYWNGINKQYTKIMLKALETMRRLNAQNECAWLDMIQGIIVSHIQCACGETYHNFEPFIVLSIEVPDGAKSLYDCLDAFFREEVVDDWKCDRCKGKRAVRLMRLWKMPRVFCVSLKRFGGGMLKNGRHIDIPDQFQLSPQSIIGPQYINRKKNVSYNLCSVALHHGSIWGGHYTAICRNDDNTWVHCDDTNCRQRISDPNVTEGYMMIYEIPTW